MIEKWVQLKLKGKIITIKGNVYLHCELIEQLHNKLIKDGFIVDIDILFNNVMKKGETVYLEEDCERQKFLRKI